MEAIFSILFIIVSVGALDALTYKSLDHLFKTKNKS